MKLIEGNCQKLIVKLYLPKNILINVENRKTNYEKNLFI
jgi:hypothetical protein